MEGSEPHDVTDSSDVFDSSVSEYESMDFDEVVCDSDSESDIFRVLTVVLQCNSILSSFELCRSTTISWKVM
jgi:hypothetical protein